MKHLTPLAILLLALSTLAQPRKPDVANQSYGPHERNVLDLYLAKSDKPTPLIIYIHGGGFVGGDKRTAQPQMITSALDNGISFAAVNYRYSTQAPYPAPMTDSARALQFLRSKAKEYNLRTDRVACYGGSAGAGISMWIAFHDDLAKPDSADPVERQSTRITCAGSMGGQCSYNPLTIKKWIGGSAWEHPALVKLYGLNSIADFDDPKNFKLMEDASAITHLTKDDAPVYMVYSEADKPLPDTAKPGEGIHHPKFGHVLKEKMDELKIECVYRHSTDRQQPPPNIGMFEFFKKYLLAP